ncbi:mandelate racemase/muconate lactonizing enzyme family protein [Alicyclobacillus macrosporangiidus]|uniref:mandelate racemase/muconate lactonizing enzyme family protein n=1 Tax=Alicyclobacillus macrosporangiidus TaxID=392015 RepID=UPI0009455083|nr:mandelate racemase/muconate lactonizing enzyme family protein [Alicyclobacillus macrosporangiidus]
MKITDVKVYPIQSELEQPFAFSQGWVTHRGATIVQVLTDEGLVGWGEALCMGLQSPVIAAATVRSTLGPLVIGEDPTNVEVLWHRMYNHVRDYGPKGAVVGAISAIDIALWDITAQSLGVPVYKLLGGKFRDRVQAYATGFYRVDIGSKSEHARLVAEAERHRANGFQAMKVKVGFGVQDDITLMRSIRQAVGDEVTLMMDGNHAYGVIDAVRLGLGVEDLSIRWFEEPVAPEHVDGYREVRAKLNIPIAGGEAEYTVYGFRNLVGGRAVDVVQPDVCHAGGFTACRHIAALAQAYGVQVNPHVWGSSIGQMASLHLIAALPIANHALTAPEPIFEYDTSSHPFRTQLIENPIEQKDGWITVPDTPGLGVRVNLEVLERYRV